MCRSTIDVNGISPSILREYIIRKIQFYAIYNILLKLNDTLKFKKGGTDMP